jgi:hypothetical protein
MSKAKRSAPTNNFNRSPWRAIPRRASRVAHFSFRNHHSPARITANARDEAATHRVRARAIRVEALRKAWPCQKFGRVES